MISLTSKGDFRKTEKFMKNARTKKLMSILKQYGEEGVAALMVATPLDTGRTASSWRYEIKVENNCIRLVFHNDNIQNGVPIAIILQYGHGTGTGGWVEGRDYINPAIQPVFDKIAKSAWKEAIIK
mgnify:FL=1